MLGDFNFHADSLDCALATDSFDSAGLLWSYLACIDLHTHASTCTRCIPWDSFPPLVTENLAKLCMRTKPVVVVEVVLISFSLPFFYFMFCFGGVFVFFFSKQCD